MPHCWCSKLDDGVAVVVSPLDVVVVVVKPDESDFGVFNVVVDDDCWLVELLKSNEFENAVFNRFNDLSKCSESDELELLLVVVVVAGLESIRIWLKLFDKDDCALEAASIFDNNLFVAFDDEELEEELELEEVVLVDEEEDERNGLNWATCWVVESMMPLK